MTSQVTISQVVISQAATSHRLGKVFSGDADRNEGRALRLGWARGLVLQLEQARAECCGQDSLIKLPFGKTSLRKYLISIKETLVDLIWSESPLKWHARVHLKELFQPFTIYMLVVWYINEKRN